VRDARGRWLPGPDPDRHRLTRREQRRGYRNAMKRVQESWNLHAWLYYRIRGYYRRQRRCA
jgi:hypothetical protein